MFGCIHPAAGSAPRATAILLCNPFGQEALRAQRVLRLLADRVARGGRDVMRFDYYATGDSDGDDHELDCRAWPADIRLADRELRTRTGSLHTAWIGLGLGANAVVHASLDSPAGPARLVLWDPVLDVDRYLTTLRATHLRYVVSPRTGLSPPTAHQDQLLGFPIPVPVLDSMRACASTPSRRTAVPHVVVVASEGTSPEALTAWGAHGAAPAVSRVRSWAAAEFDDVIASGVVYNDVVQAVAATLGDLP